MDIATLTGACMIALGDGIGGMYASSDAVAEAVGGAAKEAGEHSTAQLAPFGRGLAGAEERGALKTWAARPFPEAALRLPASG